MNFGIIVHTLQPGTAGSVPVLGVETMLPISAILSPASRTAIVRMVFDLLFSTLTDISLYCLYFSEFLCCGSRMEPLKEALIKDNKNPCVVRVLQNRLHLATT